MLKEAPVTKELDHKKVSLPTYAEKVAAETARLAALKAQWTPPDAMAAAPIAPAAGAKVLVPEFEIALGGIRRRVSAHWRAADVFDQMEQDARRAHERSRDEAPFVAPWSWGQLHMARFYRTLTERHSAGGMRCASLEAGRGGGGGGDFITNFISEGKTLDGLHAAIGPGVAMAVRRIRPSTRGSRTAGVILDRVLVDSVCLGQMTLGAVLRAAGWSPDGHHRKALRVALAAALDRMQGYAG